ncbi:putative adipose-regulatory protein (Seipin) [Forsythia ovata]|uniref:Adipose-regulatory protein (Seipin) n=1 Tax=Forsythia ovata TaxID=205694 RepID=A0ABD1WI57_9LAMI
MEDQPVNNYLPIPSPSFLLTNLISLQAEIISSCVIALVSPFIFFISLISDSFHRAEEGKETVESAVNAEAGVLSTVLHGGGLLLRKMAMGFLGAAYVCMVLIIVMVVALILGVGVVRLWVEEPVFIRESLHFDYTDVHPTAVFYFGGGAAAGGGGGVPVGHTFYVSMVLVMPESDYNRDIGIFQLTAELISTKGEVMVKSSRPCMLHFRSWPIRLMRTFFMGIPLLLGIATETQRISFPILKHKEGYPRTEEIRITLIPRAGTLFLPQFYDAEIVMNSQLPWRKELVYRWKWTFYVWTSLYIYIMLVMLLVVFFKPLIFPVMDTFGNAGEQNSSLEVSKEPRVQEGREVSESVRRWQRSRSKRKAALLHGLMPEPIGSSASSITITREETGVSFEEGTGDSESVCFRGFDE